MSRVRSVEPASTTTISSQKRTLARASGSRSSSSLVMRTAESGSMGSQYKAAASAQGGADEVAGRLGQGQAQGQLLRRRAHLPPGLAQDVQDLVALVLALELGELGL